MGWVDRTGERRSAGGGAGGVGWTAVAHMRPVMVGEDFSAFQQKAPGTFFFVGAARPVDGAVHPHHHPKFDVDEGAFESGVRIFVEAAMRYCVVR